MRQSFADKVFSLLTPDSLAMQKIRKTPKSFHPAFVRGSRGTFFLAQRAKLIKFLFVA
jgi:hypothetical protein